MRVVIEVAEGPHQGQTFAFEGHDTFLVGRSRRAHFRLPREDRYFSRIHFLVEVNPPSCRLMDMGSKNGTFVNGKRVSLVDLQDGDQIQGGKTVLRVRVEKLKAPAKRAEPVSPLITPPRRPTPPRPMPVPAAPPVAELGERCLACNASLPAAGPQGQPPLCGECRKAAARATQPIRGYCLIRELGGGEIGTTYVALEEPSGRPAAVRLFPPADPANSVAIESFLRAVAPLKLLSHPYIAGLREVRVSGGCLFAASEFIRGTDSARLVQTEGPLPVAEACELICQLLEALDHAHAEGHVHRSLKPTSLRVDSAGMLRVVDFGLAGLFRTSDLSGLSLQSSTGKALPFMAPEQVTSFREVRPAADQYSAAAVLYYLLTGRLTHEFPPSLPECMLMVLQEEPVPLRKRRPEVPPLLAEVVHRALAKEPDMRFPDAASMLQALTNCSV
jgi:serine/threonine-protein kinase